MKEYRPLYEEQAEKLRRGNPNATVRADVPLSYYKISVKLGSNHKCVEFEVDAVTVQAIAGLNKEYKGIKLNAHLVGGEAVTVIPIPFTDKELWLGGSVDIGSWCAGCNLYQAAAGLFRAPNL